MASTTSEKPPEPRPGAARTTPSAIAEAALAIIDSAGIDALNMRALGDALGVTATTVYRYFDDKDEVLRSVSQHLLQSMSVPDPAELPARDWLLALGREYARVLFEHPNAVPILLSYKTRARTLPITERIVSVFVEDGIAPADAVAILDTVESHCLGFGLIATRPATWRQPPADEAADYLHLTEAVASRQRTVAEDFEIGLAVLVDGLLATMKSPAA